MTTQNLVIKDPYARQESLKKKMNSELQNQLDTGMPSDEQQGDQLETSVNGRNAFDLQREKISSNAEADRKARTEALKRRLGATNIEGGAAEKSYQNLESEVYKNAAQQRSAVDIAELQAAEERRKADESMRLETERLKGYETPGGHVMGTAELGQKTLEQQSAEASADRASREKIAFAGFDQDSLNRAETARQFDSKIDWDKAAKSMDMNQQDADRIWDAVKLDKQIESAEKLAFANLSLEDKRLAREAYQFDTQLEWAQRAEQMKLDEATAQRSWQSAENLKAQVSNEKLASMEIENRIAIQRMVDEAATGRITLQSTIDKNNELNKMRAASYYNAGQSGQKIDTDLVNPSSPMYDPVAATAYDAGRTNIPWLDYQNRLQNTLQLQATAIASLDPEDPGFTAKLKNIIEMTGGTTTNVSNLNAGSNTTPSGGILGPNGKKVNPYTGLLGLI